MRTVRMIGSIGAGPSKNGWFRAPDGVALYKVQSGDSLSALAAKYLGKSSRYPEIIAVQSPARKASLTKNPNAIQVGEVFAMPREAVTTAERLGLVPAPPAPPKPAAKPAIPPPAAKPSAPPPPVAPAHGFRLPGINPVSTGPKPPPTSTIVLPWQAPPPAAKPSAPPPVQSAPKPAHKPAPMPAVPSSGPNPEEFSDDELQRKANETGKMQCVAGRCFMPEIEIVASPPPPSPKPLSVPSSSAMVATIKPAPLPVRSPSAAPSGIPWGGLLALTGVGLGAAYVLKNRKKLMGASS